MRKSKVSDLVYMAMFVALLAVCSWICIPMTVPVTLQTFAMFTAVAVLGMKRGVLAVLAYIILGAVGVPVFSGFRGGFGMILGATGGFLLGFVPAALVSGLIMKVFGKKTWIMAGAMIAGLLVCYTFGTVWFLCVYATTQSAVGVMTALTWCVFPFVIPDLCKIALAVILGKRMAGLVP